MEDKDIQQEIFTYNSSGLIYSANWSIRADKPYRLAFGSFVGSGTNFLEVIQLNKERTNFVRVGGIEHTYPPTKLAWIPDRAGVHSDLFATTSDYLRLYGVDQNGGVKLRSVFTGNKGNEFTAPLTSFDWNEIHAEKIVTASIDATCTIWNVERQQSVTQLIAHDKEVYDLAFSNRWPDVFASVGADGSVRMFDLRTLEHSTIIYETQDLTALVRLGWNKQDPNYIATIMADSPIVTILDIRVPSFPAAQLEGHQKSLTALSWAPHSSTHICTASDDRQALIWDISALPKPIEDPILAYNANESISQLQWSVTHSDWISIAFGRSLQMLRV
eukprot:TRINITY_DN8347_c0_g1_i2.p1 TRINITY_DN8347_c0_g1~~TRINITY_DN8347_c0_g1_i2.p1  ORF type:complete len:331 (-),score=47.83 TRINITY_DN8347_c0_g1_i2:51-1043(-)